MCKILMENLLFLIDEGSEFLFFQVKFPVRMTIQHQKFSVERGPTGSVMRGLTNIRIMKKFHFHLHYFHQLE